MLIEQRNAQRRPARPADRGGHHGPALDRRASMPSRRARCSRSARSMRIFGCWTSASRKATLPVLERLDGFLFYPSQYEGEERSPNIVYAGGTPSQTAIPAIDFLRAQRRAAVLPGRRSTTSIRASPTPFCAPIWRRAASAAATSSSATRRRGLEDWRDIGEEIRAFGARPGAAIVSTVSGDANLRFFAELARRGRGRAGTPILSLSIGEAELPALAHCGVDGDLRRLELSPCDRRRGEFPLHRRLAALQRRARRRDQ